MFIITVIPTSNIPRQETLTYFYKEAISVGALVQIPYNKNILKALVLSCVPISQVKGDIKKETFHIKKIDSVLQQNKISSQVLSGILDFGNNFFLRPATIFYDMYPTWYWDTSHASVKKTISKKSIVSVYKPTIKERFVEYKKEIKKNTLVWICVPHGHDNSALYKKLTKEWQHIYFFNSKLSAKKQLEQWALVLENHKDGVCIISSPYYLGLALETADVLVLDEYGDTSYAIHPPYYYNTRLLAQSVPSVCKKMIYGDFTPLFLSPLFQIENQNNVSNTQPLSYTVYTKISKRQNMLFVHPKIEESFIKDIASPKRILVVCQNEDQKQKIVCNDCKKTVSCTQCHSELYLKERGTEKFLSCTLCLKKYPLKMTCVDCGSWNLETLGLYKKNIKHYIDTMYMSESNAVVEIESFKNLHKYNTTELFDRMYVVSIDGYMMSPDFNQAERIYKILTRLSMLTSSLLIQTSFPAPNILTDIKKETAKSWFVSEVTKRKKYHFPPFGIVFTLRAISFKGLQYLSQIESVLMKKEIMYIRALPYSISITIPLAEENRYATFLKRLQNKDIIITKEM